MTVRLPDFLLVGAPKCGTTSMAGYLARHPEVYLSPIKEPKFFTAQVVPFPLRGPGDSFVENFTVKTFDEYQRLFKRVGNQKAVGEASVDNLYFHRQVIPLIKRYLGDVRIIIVLRNPVDRAFSAYKNMLRDGRETRSFEAALDREEGRTRRGYEYLWRYTDTGFYHEPVKAYLKHFRRVKILILEHFTKGSLEPFQRICEFLGVDPSFKPKRQMMFNVSGKPKTWWGQRPFNPTGFKGKAYKFLAMNGFNIDTLMQWVEPLRGLNLEPITMLPETRRRLHRMYAGDIEKLQNLLKTDLSHWLQPANRPIRPATHKTGDAFLPSGVRAAPRP
jgi:hypothetical protein